MNECPRCKGEGDIKGFACGDGFCLKPVIMPCELCKGTGEVNDMKLDWIKRGEVMRQRRVHEEPYVTIWAAAEARGITSSQYSKMEQGITEPGK